MFTQRRFLILGLLAIGSAVAYQALSGSPPVPRKAVALDDAAATEPSKSKPAGASKPDRVEVAQEEPRGAPIGNPEAPKPTGIWTLDGARRDEHGILLDLKPYLHKSINNYALNLDGSSKDLPIKALLQEAEVNPDRAELTAEDYRNLGPVLASHRQVMAEIGPLSTKLLADAFHELIERGGMQEIGREEKTVKDAQLRLLDEMTNRFGACNREFVWMVAGGPLDRDQQGKIQISDTVDTYVLAVHRGIAPEAFAVLDEVNRVKDDVRRILREYLARKR